MKKNLEKILNISKENMPIKCMKMKKKKIIVKDIKNKI